MNATLHARRSLHRRVTHQPLGPLHINRVARLTQLDRAQARWSRISGIVPGNEPYMDRRERRAGIKRLVRCIEDRVRQGQRRCRGDAALPVLRDKCAAPGSAGTVVQISCVTDTFPNLHDWARVRHAGESVESLCGFLGISESALSKLTHEFCHLAVEDLVDGLKLNRLKHELITQLRRAARTLWGMPGELADVQCMNQSRDGIAIPEHTKTWRDLQEWRRDTNRRGHELIAKVHALREQGVEDAFGDPLPPIDLDSVALRLGFDSVARLRRAIFSVFGQSLDAIELHLAKEIAYYYACAEERHLRETALMPGKTAFIMRARYLYGGDEEEAPTKPFLDMWSAAAECKPEWTEKMMKEFG